MKRARVRRASDEMTETRASNAARDRHDGRKIEGRGAFYKWPKVS
ncbi:MAG TPA: hypothetical protein VGW12_20130 [Pyrinomonadaceae bacterium]|nr:hypothetical protein [Pyrinomonadaceae bacterium]